MTKELEDYGLEKNAEIRFKIRDGQTWQSGTAMDSDENYIEVLDKKFGYRRYIPFKLVQKLTKGPRGGKSWSDIT